MNIGNIILIKMIVESASYRTFKANICTYEIEPELHTYIGVNKEIVEINIIIPTDWVGNIRNIWTSPSCACEDDETNTNFGYPGDSGILLYNIHNQKYNINTQFPRGVNNEFVERYRHDLFKSDYNDNNIVAQQWFQNIQDIVDNTDPYRFVTELERSETEDKITREGHLCHPAIPHGYFVDIDKVIQDLIYYPDVNSLPTIWYSPSQSKGTNSLSKLINNINVGEILDLLWPYFYHDYNSCGCDHLFDPYNTLNLNDEIVFPIHVSSIFGYSDKITLLSKDEDELIYDYHVNLRFKQNIQPTVIPEQELNHTTKNIIGMPT